MLQIHTDPQAESMGGMQSGNMAGMSPNVLGSDNMMGMSPNLPGSGGMVSMGSSQGGMMGMNSGQYGGAGMTPMQADSGNMALIPQRPDHIMLQQEGIETIEGPASGREVTNSSVRGLLARNLGYYVVASFLMGTQQAIQWEGILASVGNDYLVIYQPDQNRFVSGDIYSLKFVEFHEDQSPCAAGYRRRDAFQGW